MRKAYAGLIAILLAGCASSGPSLEATPGPAESARAPREIVLPAVRMASGNDALILTLGADLDQPGAPGPYLKVEITYTAAARRSYDTARDMQGRALATKSLPGADACRPGPPCLYQEASRVALPLDDLRQSRTTGYRLKLVSRNGLEIEIGIPGAQIAALLDRIEGPPPSPPAMARKGT